MSHSEIRNFLSFAFFPEFLYSVILVEIYFCTSNVPLCDYIRQLRIEATVRMHIAPFASFGHVLHIYDFFHKYRSSGHKISDRLFSRCSEIEHLPRGFMLIPVI